MAADGRRFRATKEALSICRRDVRKLLSAAMEEGVAGDWGRIEELFPRADRPHPRTPTNADIEPILDEMQMLREEIINRLRERRAATCAI
ncbi:hypothetical protein GGE07_005929 [Sinorhizobium terangae]|nr:hypothetical protein [Sinorhizobium terangae]